jgi:hypothetical protein
VDRRHVSEAKSGLPFAAEEICRLSYENNSELVLWYEAASSVIPASAGMMEETRLPASHSDAPT